MPHKVFAISGGLESNSCSSGLLRAALQIQHPELQIIVCDISTFPIFNMDIIFQSGYPAQVQEARNMLAESDGLFIAIAQMNNKVSSALKNAYDWLSFAADGNSPIKEKATGIISAGMNGGSKGQEHFKRVCQYCKLKLMENTVKVNEEPANFDNYGNLVSEAVRGDLKNFLEHLNEFLIAAKNK